MNKSEYYPWSETAESNLKRLSTSRENGLTEQEAQNRLNQYGINRLKETKKQINNFKMFKKLVDEWTSLALQHAKLKIEIAKEKKKP